MILLFLDLPKMQKKFGSSIRLAVHVRKEFDFFLEKYLRDSIPSSTFLHVNKKRYLIKLAILMLKCQGGNPQFGKFSQDRLGI
jgi:hypothetical protein